jgi:hypothetical protein
VLADLAGQSGARSVSDTVEQLFDQRADLEDEALGLMTARGIIRNETTRLLWVIDRERFPLVDGKPQQSVTVRLAQAVLGDDIPDVRDIMLVSLAHASGLLDVVLAPAQIESRAEWIESLSKIETISRNVSAAITELRKNIQRGMGYGPF